MSFYSTQEYPNRKDWRKEGPVAHTCKPHGSCPWCRSNRTHSVRKAIRAIRDRIRDWVLGEDA
jgi:hypothetical protein